MNGAAVTAQLMKAIAGGVSAGGSLAVAHHLLSLFQGPPPELFGCDLPGAWSLDWRSFSLGLACGCILVFVIQIFTALRWAFIAYVQYHLAGGFGGDQTDRGKVLYKLL